MTRQAGADRTEHGASAVEFALIAPLLLLILLGIISYGFMLTLRQSISQAATEGARAAAVTLRTDQRTTEARSALDDAMSAHGVTCDDQDQLVRSSTVVGTCTVSRPAPCRGAITSSCVTVTLSYDYRAHPLVPSAPGLGLVIPRTLSYSATARVS